MKSHRSPRAPLAVSALLLASFGWSGPSAAQVTDVKGGPIESVVIVRQPLRTQTNSTVFVDVPDVSTTIKVRPKTLVIANLSAESSCGGPAQSFSSVRVVAVRNGDVVELKPTFAFDFAFDWVGEPDRSVRSLERSIVLKQAGKYKLQLQHKVSGATTVCSIGGISFKIETARSRV